MGRNKKEKEEKFGNMNFQKPELNLSSETKRGISVVVFVLLGLISFLAVMDLSGSFGQYMLSALKWLLGVLAYAFPILMILLAIRLAFHLPESKKDREEMLKNRSEDKGFYLRTYLGSLMVIGTIAGIIHLFVSKNSDLVGFELAMEGKGGGLLGAIFAVPTLNAFGFLASNIVLVALLIIGILIVFNIPLHALWPKKAESEENENIKISKEKISPTVLKINSMASSGFAEEKVLSKNKKIEDEEISTEQEVKVPAKPNINKAENSVSTIESITIEDRKDWKLPPFDLLDDNQTQVDSGNIEVNVAIIKKTLSDFGIDVEMGEVNVGPTVTQYTLRPTTGVKLSQIAGLQNDLALSLAAHSIRMELPIPGKALVGIEVPNKSTAIVRLREVMQTKDYVDHKSKLVLALGRDVAGKQMVIDLAKMPHLLIAGATGTGKSVCINSLFISLLYRNTPQDVKFIVIDPKRVEMTPYNGIPHLLTPVVMDHEKAVNALKWAVSEMDRRYKILSEAGKRNITEYNEIAPLKMPYIVILVDELADLMAVAQADVEASIVRLSQMARAIGIHLVLATQRPSVEIITGLIKANITSRIAFAVASQIDSRTILDMSGAEKLLGNGDMLYTSAEYNKPKRVQGAYIGEKEVKKVVDFFKAQTGAVIYNEEILEKPKRSIGVPGFEGGSGGGSDEDDLLEEAMEEVRRAGKASASLLQRRLRIGYARAARLLDILEDKGIIGPGDGAKPREVYGVIPAEEKAEYGIEEENQH
jgi:DNA segregation ATPase FtsK/SpoIIIE, S-DNA-T family